MLDGLPKENEIYYDFSKIYKGKMNFVIIVCILFNHYYHKYYVNKMEESSSVGGFFIY